MVVIRTVHELLEAFRPLDLRLFELPGENAYPMPVPGYTSWVEAGGARVYLVFEEPGTGKPRGIIFQRSREGSGSTPVQMCGFCNAHGTSDEIGLLVAEVTPRRRAGVFVCRDLACGDRLEEEADRTGSDRALARRRLIERLARFSREALLPDP